MALDPDALLELLRDPNAETQHIAEAAGVPREEVGRAARLVLGMARAKPEEVAGLPPVLALAALRAAASAGRADVLAAAAASGSREVAKEAKRRLHLLRTRGVEVPELPRPAPAPPPPAAEPELPCYASAPDGQGERAVWLARAVPGKGVELAQAILSDERGLVSLQVGTLGRKEYRTFAGTLVERGASLGVAEVPRDLARSLVAEARRAGEAAGRPLPEGASLWLSRLGEAAPPPDPASRFPPLAPEAEREAVAGSATLHQLPGFRGWLAHEEALRAAAQKLDEIASSPIVLDARQKAERARGVIDEAVVAYFDAARRALWSRRLLAAAAHLADRGDPGTAAAAAAVARALASGADALAVPFARLLFEKALSAAGEPPGEGEAGAGAPPAP